MRSQLRRILIAEDDRFMANICRLKFEEAGFSVLVAHDGHDVVEQLILNPPDVVLLDLMIPGLDGVGVLKFLRSRDRLRNLPVVVISNSSHFSGVVQQAWQAGATHFISKAEASPDMMIEEVFKAMMPKETSDAPLTQAGISADEPPPLPPVRPNSGPPRIKVLLADDDTVIHNVLTYFLNLAGFEVRSAFDGRQAMEMAISQAPDLLILDGMMPGLDGIQVLERWSIHPTLSTVPVLMLTGDADEGKRATAMEHGAVAYLVKPFSPEELVKRVQHFI